MERAPMRDFSEFCEQLNEIKLKFHKWDSCEKTVGLYYLMVGLPFGNARFLQHALEKSITAVNSTETQIMERNANNPAFVSNFFLEQPQAALSLLLDHLPLLKPGNKEAAECYLTVIRQVMLEFITPPLKIYNECVEIMSYVYIHPAFTNEDKRSFKNLLKQVMNKVTPDNFIHSPSTESSDESVSPNPESIENLKRLSRRSNSLTPAQDNWYSQESISQAQSKPRSYSLSSEKSLLAGMPSLPTTRSETRLQDLILMNNLPAMKTVVSWLKSLRLHKYSWVFNNLTYSRMINLNEETLQAIGITKGARHKLLLSISVLRERSLTLTELETEVMNGGDIHVALKKLKSVLQTPLQISMDDEDLPSQFVKVMGKVCTQLLMLRQPSDESIILFNSLCERVESIDSFTDEQKRRLNLWKSQLMKEDSPTVYTNHQQYPSINYGCQKDANKCNLPKMCSSVPTTSSYAMKSSSYPNMKPIVSLQTHRHSVGSVTLQNQLFSAPHNQHIFRYDGAPDYNDYGKQLFETNPNNFSLPAQDIKIRQDSNHKTDIESSLESLCIQMMEHALGP